MLPPFLIRKHTMQYIHPVCAGARQAKPQPDAPPTHHLHNSRIVKDQPISDFQKKPEESADQVFALFYLLSSSLPHSAGGANRDRTGDLLLAKQALSQLSYGPLDPPQTPSHSLVMVGLDGFEPSTPRLSSVCSDQLSYRPCRAPCGEQLQLLKRYNR